MIIFPNAKINIGLNILDKRLDGFHNLQSIFYPIDLQDALEVSKSMNGVTLQITGLTVDGKIENNLVYRAWQLMKEKYEVPAINVHLHKCIPLGGGLGGGSADGAAMINLLAAYFDLKLSLSVKEELAATLGSDCPFFIKNQPALIEGRGEKVSEIDLDLSSYFIAVVNPGIHINTANAFANIGHSKDKKLAQIIKLPIESWKDNLTNDFEDNLFLSYPKIRDIKEKLYSWGALYASMTGSGSSVYGIFNNLPDSLIFPENYFIWTGKMR